MLSGIGSQEKTGILSNFAGNILRPEVILVQVNNIDIKMFVLILICERIGLQVHQSNRDVLSCNGWCVYQANVKRLAGCAFCQKTCPLESPETVFDYLKPRHLERRVLLSERRPVCQIS